MSFKILSVNSGSSSIKCKLFLMPERKLLAYFVVERLGTNSTCKVIIEGKDAQVYPMSGKTLIDAVDCIIDLMVTTGVVNDLSEIKGIGHRVVQGGDYFDDAVEFNADVEQRILDLVPLAPLHNPANLACYREFKKKIPNVGEVAVFDTTLFCHLPDDERYYPIDYDLTEKYHIRRYGAHGISHKYLYNKCVKDYFNNVFSNKNIITMHIGNGASLSAFKNGVCIATSMGLTPLGGVMMGTRCGDLDPSIVTYIEDISGMSSGQIEYILTKHSGLLGVSGISNDVRDIKKAIDEDNNKRALLAKDLFLHSIAKQIGSYYVELGRIDALVFSGGIFENCVSFRKGLVDISKEALGLDLNDKANEIMKNGKEGIISTDKSKVSMIVIPTDEELMIAIETARILKLQ